jgi:hypothetical protein
MKPNLPEGRTAMTIKISTRKSTREVMPCCTAAA